MENIDIDRTKSRMVDVETNTPSTWDNLEEKLKEEFPKVAENKQFTRYVLLEM